MMVDERFCLFLQHVFLMYCLHVLNLFELQCAGDIFINFFNILQLFHPLVDCPTF